MSPKVGREEFLKLLNEQFPEVVETFNELDLRLLHLEVAAFRQCVECAMDEGRLWNVERYLRFVDDVFPRADATLVNALAVSFIEDLALGECNETRRSALRARAPKRIREQVVAINSQWR